MGKFNITESEKKSIRKMYGLIEEQIQLPKIVSGSFSSSDGNSAHNFKQLETKLDQILPQLYNQGINPKITSVTAQIKKNGNQFVTNYSVTIDKSNDGKAWMGFTSRGSSGNDYERRADGQIDGSTNEDGRSLEEKLKSIGAGEIVQIKGSPVIDRSIPFKQYFVQFTKPSEYPSYTSVPQEKITNTNVGGGETLMGSVPLQGNAFNELSKKLQDWTKSQSEDGKSFTVGNFELNFNKNKNEIFFRITRNPKGQKFTKLVLAINDEAKKTQESKGYVLIKNGNIQLPGEFASSRPNGYGWYLFGEPYK